MEIYSFNEGEFQWGNQSLLPLSSLLFFSLIWQWDWRRQDMMMIDFLSSYIFHDWSTVPPTHFECFSLSYFHFLWWDLDYWLWPFFNSMDFGCLPTSRNITTNAEKGKNKKIKIVVGGPCRHWENLKAIFIPTTSERISFSIKFSLFFFTWYDCLLPKF